MTAPSPARAQEPEFHHQLQFPPAPATAADAVAGFAERKNAAIDFAACGHELDFSRLLFHAEDDLMAILIAKLDKFYQLAPSDPPSPEAVCRQTRSYRTSDADTQRLSTLDETYQALFGPECADPVSFTAIPPDVIRARFRISAACLRRQVNVVVGRLAAHSQLGTEGLPCDIGALPGAALMWLISSGALPVSAVNQGDYDVTVRGLLRLFYLDKARGHRVLDPDSRSHVRDNLITVGFGPVQESYSIFSCGNQEHTTGSPSERADDLDFVDRALDALGDLFKWLARRWLIVVIFLGTVGLAVYLAASPAAAVLAVATAGALVAGEEALFRIPETENHLLMIETSRYLNNQLILEDPDLQNHPNRGRIEAFQREVREWLLRRMQRVMQEDFREYNSRPYQSYTLPALLNLYDFASPDDPQVKDAAGLVLDFAAAKAALGSNRSRRVVPFRRLLTETQNVDLFNLTTGADYQIILLLLYTGQTQAVTAHRLDLGAARNMVAPATSTYRPPNLILDLAIDKAQAYYQRVRHDGVELYSSTNAFLISAGGIRSGAADTLLGFGRVQDEGGAVPTVLIPTAGGASSSRNDFLRIEGGFYKLGTDGTREIISYDHNACLYKGFACGLNLVVPGDFELGTPDPASHGREIYKGCLEQGPAGAPAAWRFIYSAKCEALKAGPPFYVAVYRAACPAANDVQCRRNYGFFEAVPAPGPRNDLAFELFKEKVLANNPAVMSPALPYQGRYRTFAAPGQTIQFDLVRHQNASDEWPILSVDPAPPPAGYDIDDWPLAWGDVLTANGDGLVTIRKPGTSTVLNLDLTKWDEPKRTP